MSERPEYEGTKPEYWRGIDRRRALSIIGAVALVLAIIAIAVAMSLAAERRTSPEEETSATITPAERADETSSGAAVATDVPSATVPPAAVGEGATPPGTDAGAGAAPSGPAGRVARVAYRREGWLCVADEDGSSERQVVASASGAFSLAPDGGTLAYVDAASNTLWLASVEAGRTFSVGPVGRDRPSWSPDSAWLVYTAPGPSVRKVARDGAGGTTLFTGSLPAVSSDGALVVGVSEADEEPGIAVWRAGVTSRIPVAQPVTGLASDGARVYFGARPAGVGSASLHVIGLDGGEERVLVPAPATWREVAFCDLALSPDATRLVYAECGDDGYSRLFALSVAGGVPTSLSTRRDCYPMGWTASGDGVLFIEGNAFQGEASALVGVRPNGTSRRLLVQGAGR